MEDYSSQDHWRRENDGLDKALDGVSGDSVLAIPQDSLQRLELAGFCIRPTAMAPLQPSSTHTHYKPIMPYRGNCRRSSARSRTRSDDSKYSELSDASAFTVSSRTIPPPPPIAGDAFAMHPELLPPDAHGHSDKEPTGRFNPLVYWRRKRSTSGGSSAQPRPPSPVASSHAPSVIFIDVPSHSE
jgi:hypothetical protein